MNRRAKGRRVEIMCKKALEGMGYQVELASPKLVPIGPGKIISKSHDMFGIWDIIAVKEMEPILFIQVTSSYTDIADKRRQILKFPWPFHSRQELWYYEGRGKLRVWIRAVCEGRSDTWIEQRWQIRGTTLRKERIS